jgi:hypothetical protein
MTLFSIQFETLGKGYNNNLDLSNNHSTSVALVPYMRCCVVSMKNNILEKFEYSNVLKQNLEWRVNA